MERIGFRLQVRPEMMNEYVRRHLGVWTEMLTALEETGWKNYSLYLDRSDGTLFGYFETPDFSAAKSGMAAREINERWQSEMAPFFLSLDGRRPDEGFLQLEEVFHLN